MNHQASHQRQKDADGTTMVRVTTTTGKTRDVEIAEQTVHLRRCRIDGRRALVQTLTKEGLVRLETERASYFITGSEFLKLLFEEFPFIGREEEINTLGREKAQLIEITEIVTALYEE